MPTSPLTLSSVKKSLLRVALLVAVPLMPQPSSSYEMYPRSTIHEELTVASIECADRLRQEPAYRCPTPALDGRFSMPAPPDGYLFNGLRWNDDPTRLLRSGGTFATFGTTMIKYCTGRARKDGVSINDGLLCRSHYGDMQFLHAMASAPGESPKKTLEKMMAWAHFVYDIATGRLPLTTPARDIGSKRYPALLGIFDDSSFRGNTGARPWTVSTIFNLYCTGIISNAECIERFPDATGTGLYAIGTLLHLVQDSFARGHVLRRERRDEQCGVAVVDCGAIHQFRTYWGQDDGRHRLADGRPVFDSSCGAQDGPVQAGAQLLVFLRPGREAPPAEWEDVEGYLLKKVFVMDEARAVSAAAGECFIKP